MYYLLGRMNQFTNKKNIDIAQLSEFLEQKPIGRVYFPAFFMVMI